MWSTLVPILCCLTVAAVDDELVSPGMQWTFRGDVRPANRQQPATGSTAVKNFDVTFWVREADDASAQLYWLVDERGAGQWPWIERFGRLALDAAYRPVGPMGPALLYDYGDGKSALPLGVPLLKPAEPPAKGVAWQQDNLEMEVEGSASVADRDCWRIDVRTASAPKRTVWLEKGSPLVVALEERVFMDRGTEYQLQWKFVGAERLDPTAFQATERTLDELIALRNKLKRPQRSQSEDFSAEQRELLAAELPKIAPRVEAGSLAELLRTAMNELKTQAGRADAVASLREKFIGKPVPTFVLEGLGDEHLTNAEVRGKVTILHFWEYRNEPLKEPYGQIGYLEFLHSRRGSEGVQVFGVAVDGRLQKPQTRPAAVSSVRKLKEFMNLTYPILLDDGRVLGQFGDPRTLGAPLPLYVVIDRQGNVADYHVGLHTVDRQEGLKDLDSLVRELAE
ncbi:MAG TPA: redoxin domain-containing protein [Pirellulales bacterium]|jgi:peroxiredoxin|nr:redoxin domain-containing protein [Pirellulales bacterium]